MRATSNLLKRSPLYAVPFNSAQGIESDYFPLVAGPQGNNSGFTVPHGLDRRVATALPGLWYCLHLPNTFQEMLDIPARVLKAGQTLHLDHHILLLPIDMLDEAHTGRLLETWIPTMVVCPDDLVEEASRRSEALGFALPPAAYSELSDRSLKSHWRAIRTHFLPEVNYIGREPTLTQRLDFGPTELPRRWLARQMGVEPESLTSPADDPGNVMRQALWEQLILAATSRLENEQTSLNVARTALPEVIDDERHRLRLPVVLALPGVPPAYARGAYDTTSRGNIQPLSATDEEDTWSVAMDQRTDAMVERATIELVATHQALARTGVGLMLPTVPAETFIKLAQLERHFEGNQNGPTVWRLLDQLDQVAQPIWTQDLEDVVPVASALTVFSNFPIGLLRLPGDTAPLVARVPIAYRPLLPLTRALQKELSFQPPVEITKDLRVLVAECIRREDPVGRVSRKGWRFVREHVARSAKNMSLSLVETLAPADLRAAIADKRPHILVISAHGSLNRAANLAGLVIGDELTVGLELGPMPPVVVLSACHVAPRGGGMVSITDLLLREGAVAVLGTQVPVNVFHNAMLMMRFFLYVSEVLEGREEHPTLLDIWHRVQTSNAVNDVLNGSRSLREWGRSATPSGLPVLQEFMSNRATGQLRMGHIYADTERVLGRIADDQGVGSRVRNWFRSPGYVPESLFYVFAGRPERIYLRPLSTTYAATSRRKP